MPTENGLFKQVSYKVETGYGTKPAAAAAQALRRVTSTLDLRKDTYQSNEVRPDLQLQDFRHGVRRVNGAINGELSAKTYADFIAAALKRDFAAVTPITGASLTIAGTGPTYTVTRAAGSFLTDGVKIGDVIRLAAAGMNANNSAKNLMVVALTATVATVMVLNASGMTAEGPIASSSVTVAGKKTFVPQTGHTDKSFSIEHFFPANGQSEVFTGCKPTNIAIELPPTGLATINTSFTGKDLETASAQYFTNPTALTATGALAAVNGVARMNGSTIVSLTGLSLQIASPQTGDPTVGSNTIAQQFPGRVVVTGQFTAYFDSVALRDAFINESEIDLYAVFTADNTAAADFVAIGLPRIKLGTADKSDGETGIVQTFQFQALLNSAGGAGTATEKTTIQIQDSQA
jgi:hypothetical protein